MILRRRSRPSRKYSRRGAVNRHGRRGPDSRSVRGGRRTSLPGRESRNVEEERQNLNAGRRVSPRVSTRPFSGSVGFCFRKAEHVLSHCIDPRREEPNRHCDFVICCPDAAPEWRGKFSVLQAIEKSRNRKGIWGRARGVPVGATPSIGLAPVDDRFGLDLDLVIADQAGNLQQRVGRPYLAEIAAVDAGDGLALRGVLQIDASAHDVL